jgi:putative proteasome-type protease
VAILCLVSMVGTERSNLSVGPPFEIAIYPRDQLFLSHRLTLDEGSPELEALSRSWSESLSHAFSALPRFSWEPGGPPGWESGSPTS